ncbi:hypothetical protein GBL_0084 [Geobacillus kaustophilus GBlys]|uniref:Uncharacterized protein n=1 Tax=Geobacillus kaustophilus GBlys TaxID=1337888 RepID=U2X0R2_GEOKU|nr:hypothetical protein GBL_0084 [Geobacillus kaustophilus GBlys]
MRSASRSFFDVPTGGADGFRLLFRHWNDASGVFSDNEGKERVT